MQSAVRVLGHLSRVWAGRSSTISVIPTNVFSTPILLLILAAAEGIFVCVLKGLFCGGKGLRCFG